MLTSAKKLAKDIQFFLLLKIFIREKASDQSCRFVGITKLPFASCQPYDGL